ncbi:prolyl oligopeptidase family serine peptidase [Kitasatospora sp. MAP5-34]|uniref:prolyl oligopeptidase family serine peptidase n=1 Tax=Kitasatospora sp. MAP5-34 TaxID=3035102 RepID=UPI002476E86D|nr:prolyl oligopeptidase family serine peptidase [Kitasatospora sp. MAP5-34]MDH6579916.1 prolyl oligopeptidase [Kitasatospora sp. MAP5-34]
MTSLPRYPEADRQQLVEEIHGRPVSDPYRWLEVAEDPRTAAWSAAQDELFAEGRASWSGRERLSGRLAELAAPGAVSRPVARGGRLFFTRRRPGQDQSVLMVVEGSVERVLLDPQAVDPGGATVLDSWKPSLEGELLAYQLSSGGTEQSVLRVLDVATGEVVDGPVDRVRRTPVAWLPGGRRFYYVRRLPGEDHYHRRVQLRELGTSPEQDAVVFGEGREKTQFYGVDVSPDGRWLTVSATAGTSPRTDLWLADLTLTAPDSPLLRPVQEGLDARTALSLRPGTGPADTVHLRTDREARRGRIAVSTPDELAAGRWHDLVPEDPEAVLEDLAVLDGPGLATPLVLVTRSRHAVSEITVHRLSDGEPLGTVPLPGPGTVGSLSADPLGGTEVWFGFTDHTTVPEVYRYDARTGRTELWARPEGTAPTAGVKSCQLTYHSHDGTPVRMFVVSPTGTPDRPRPTVLSGYGGFGASTVAGYSPHAIAWAQAGGVFVTACIRGGREEGEDWHRDGMLERKQNVFDDFDAAADWLVGNGWTTHEQLGIMGGSNGGLLVGAALTQHPEKYAAVVCMAPLLDMVRYELSGMGPSWRTEYGSAADPAHFANLLGYSPYHRVREGVRYPSVLFAVFDGDSRVDPLHARKMCAALQHASVGTGPVLLRLERGVGHGARPVSKGVELTADALAFLADALGLEVR